MSRTDIWLGSTAPNPFKGSPELRSYDSARLIDAEPVWVVLTRKVRGQQKGEQLAPQQVRVDVVQSIRNASEHTNMMMDIADQYVVLVGYRDHPTLPNTDILRGDTFYLQNRAYEVIETFTTKPGIILASCSLTTGRGGY